MLELIAEVRAKLGMSVVLITHDLGVVAGFCDRVVVMYAGQIVESGPTAEVIGRPRHPYTPGLAALDSAAGASRPADPANPGQVPDLIDMPPQCRFYSRCSLRRDACLKPIAMTRVVRGPHGTLHPRRRRRPMTDSALRTTDTPSGSRKRLCWRCVTW